MKQLRTTQSVNVPNSQFHGRASLRQPTTRREALAFFSCRSRNGDQRGLAIILVLLVIALASIILINLAYTASLESQTNRMVEESLKSEYLLKSAVNIARSIIGEDTSPEDGPQDTWAYFIDGQEIPLSMLELNLPGTRLALEIRPEEAKFPIRSVLSSGTVQPKWRDALTRLFQSLGFDEDNEEDTSGLFAGRVFNSEEMVANLIDYMDRDDDPYTPDDFASGIEDQVPRGYFPNSGIRRVADLASIPGYTPNRMRLLGALTTTFGNSRRVNINLATSVVLQSLSEDLDENIVRSIIEFRESAEGPFYDGELRTELSKFMDDALYNEIANMLSVRSSWFQVIAKVETGASLSFMRAYLSKSGTGKLPVVRLTELY